MSAVQVAAGPPPQKELANVVASMQMEKDVASSVVGAPQKEKDKEAERVRLAR